MTTSPTTSAQPLVGVTTVSGGSDDLIEFAGAIYEEFLHYGPGPARLVFDNGVILDIEYTNEGEGIWRITVVAGHRHVVLTPCPDPTGAEIYTDSAVVTGARAVTFGEQTATARG